MVKFPEAQKIAQAEIDAFVAQEHRAPDLIDMERLPYIGAVLKESFRYVLRPHKRISINESYLSIIPPVSLGAPHRSIVGETYRGFWIPPDTPILANIWSVSSR
jgi:Cytochrome P450